MASYQQNYDPQSYQFRPYELPYNGIMKRVQANSQYWIQGAEQLKNAYQQAAGLDLSLDGNREVLKNFMGQANQQVSKAAKSDLSDGDNISSALSIFKPLYSGDTEMSQNLMGDHAITSKAKQIGQEYKELRIKNGGKGYSSVNQQYSLDSYNEFLKGNDPKSWKQHYQNLKEAIPYYDYKPEIDKAIQGCKTTNGSAGVNGMYITSSSTTTIDRGCLSGSLSTNAERQIQIEGYVRYGKNYGALRDQYAPILIQDRAQTSKDRGALSARLLDPKITPEQKEAIHQMLDHYDDVMHNMDESINKLHSGDLSDIKNNYEAIAGSVFKGQKMNAISSAFSHTESIKADPVQMMYERFKNERALLNQAEAFKAASQDRDEAFRLKLQMIKNGKKTNANGEEVDDISTYIPVAGTDDHIEKTEEDHANLIKANQDKLNSLDTYMYQTIKTDPRYAKVLKDGPNSPEFKEVVNSLVKDYQNQTGLIGQALKQRQDLIYKKGNLMLEKQIIESTPKSKMARNEIQSVLDNIIQSENLNIKGDNGTLRINITPEDMKNLLTVGHSGNIKLTTRTVYARGSAYGNPTAAQENVLQVNGNSYPITGTQLSKYLLATKGKAQDYQNVLNQQYNENYVSQFPYLSLAQKNDEKDIDPARWTIGTALSGVTNKGGVDAAKAVTLVGSRYNDKVVINIEPNIKKGVPEPYDIKDLKKAFQGTGMDIEKNESGGTNTYTVTLNGVVKGFDRTQGIDQIQGIQDFAERITRLKQQGGDVAPRTLMQPYKGFEVAAVTDPNGGIRFEVKDKADKIQILNNAAELVNTLDQLSRSQVTQ